MPKVKVSVEEVRKLLTRRAEINSIPFSNIEWIGKDGKPIWVSKKVKKNWGFIGLCNMDFAREAIDKDNVVRFECGDDKEVRGG